MDFLMGADAKGTPIPLLFGELICLVSQELRTERERYIGSSAAICPQGKLVADQHRSQVL